MVNPYIAVGAAQGLENARRRFRDERMQDEDRAQRAEDRAELKEDRTYARKRRDITDAREDEAYEYEKGERPLRRRALEAQVTGAETSAETGQEQLKWAREDRPNQVEANKLGLDAARTSLDASKDNLQFNRDSRRGQMELQDAQIKKIRQQMEDEGLGRLLDTLDAGGDPEYAVQVFNSQGKNGIRPGSLRYDKATGAISFTGKDGHAFNGTVQQLRSILPEKAAAKPMVVGAGGSVYDPKTGTFKQAPGGKGGSGSGVGPNGQKLSPFNPQTHGEQTRRLVIQGLGGEWDNQLQRFRVPAGMGEKVSYGTSLADQVIRTTTDEGMQLGPGEVANVVNTVMRRVRTSGEAMRQAKNELQNADEASLQVRADEIMNMSKIDAAQALKQELDMVRSAYQQQQNSQAWPPAQETSPDMEGGESLETPPVEMLREGYVQSFQDGSKWTLQNGRAVRVNQ